MKIFIVLIAFLVFVVSNPVLNPDQIKQEGLALIGLKFDEFITESENGNPIKPFVDDLKNYVEKTVFIDELIAKDLQYIYHNFRSLIEATDGYVDWKYIDRIDSKIQENIDLEVFILGTALTWINIRIEWVSTEELEDEFKKIRQGLNYRKQYIKSLSSLIKNYKENILEMEDGQASQELKDYLKELSLKVKDAVKFKDNRIKWAIDSMNNIDDIN